MNKKWEFSLIKIGHADFRNMLGSSKPEAGLVAKIVEAVEWCASRAAKSHILDVVRGAMPDVDKANSKHEQVEIGWLGNFFDKAKNISDKEMQTVWSKILAGEFNNPGSFSRKTVEILSMLEKADAEWFENLCSFVVKGEIFMNFSPLIFDYQGKIYNDNGISFDALDRMAHMGLITSSGIVDYSAQFPPKDIVRTSLFCYGPKQFSLSVPAGKKEVPKGKTIFTKSGKELARVCTVKNIPEFPDYFIAEYKKRGFEVQPVNAP